MLKWLEEQEEEVNTAFSWALDGLTVSSLTCSTNTVPTFSHVTTAMVTLQQLFLFLIMLLCLCFFLQCLSDEANFGTCCIQIKSQSRSIGL
jgi:hypothetical protein